MTQEKNINITLLAIMAARLVFVFVNAANTNQNIDQVVAEDLKHASANTKIENTKKSSLMRGIPKEESMPWGIREEGISQIERKVGLGDTIQETQQITKKIQNTTNLNDDIKTLEAIYTQDKDVQVLKTLIEKSVQNYDFEKAVYYLQEIFEHKDYKQDISPKLHLYITLHDTNIVSITNPQSIKNIIPIMEEYQRKGLIAKDDYIFYQAIIKLRHKEYKTARELFNQINTPFYQESIQSITQAIAQYDTSKNIPKHYQDGLVALSLLKNGYFSVAKKIALETALQDKKYILPYQILAYTHFLTNNRETAAEYFLKLADVDTPNQSLYKFLIGISNYRSQDYRKGILYLSQTTDPELQTDTYRYLINSYLEEDDIQNATSTRQKLLGQDDIHESDFYHYFYQTFYKPYLEEEKTEIYDANPLLTEMYLNKCSNSLSGSDVCIFGQIGQELIKSQGLSASTPSKTSLAGLDFGLWTNLAKKYNTWFLFQIIGDIYTQNGQYKSAEENYIKALSLTNNNKEQKRLNNKISKLE